MQKFGIDISHWQGDFDFYKAKEEGVEFAILKIGERTKRDVRFNQYYNTCKLLGIPVGCYYFGNATTKQEAEEEAMNMLQLLAGYKFELPVYYDVEAKMLNVTDDVLHENVEAFCNIVESAGYFVGIYASESVFKRINDTHFTHWVAKWSSKEPKIAHPLWQFGGEINKIRTNKIAGVTCDQNYLYTDFETIIKNNGLNGYWKEEIKEEKSKIQILIEKLNEIIEILKEIEEDGNN